MSSVTVGYQMPFVDSMEPSGFTRRAQDCSVIVAHAGIGSILTALQYGKPILVMPRHAALNATRNDHQIATAARLGIRPGIEVAMDESEIADKLDRLGSLGRPRRSLPRDHLSSSNASKGS